MLSIPYRNGQPRQAAPSLRLASSARAGGCHPRRRSSTRRALCSWIAATSRPRSPRSPTGRASRRRPSTPSSRPSARCSSSSLDASIVGDADPVPLLERRVGRRSCGKSPTSRRRMRILARSGRAHPRAREPRSTRCCARRRRPTRVAAARADRYDAATVSRGSGRCCASSAPRWHAAPGPRTGCGRRQPLRDRQPRVLPAARRATVGGPRRGSSGGTPTRSSGCS